MAFVAGQKLRVSDLTGGVSGGSGGSGGGGTSSGVSIMGTDVTVNNSTTFVDSGLALDVVAGATYDVYAWLKYTSLTAPDIKFSTTRPSGTTGFWAIYGHALSGTPALDSAVGITTVVEDISVSKKLSGDSTGALILSGLVIGTMAITTNGTFKIRVAQNTSNASNTVLKAGSFMRLSRLA